jgi:hypothetical protein
MPVTVKTVSVNYERKANLGDYNSAAVGCTIWADVTEDENLDEAMHLLWSMAKENVRAQLVPLDREAKNKGAVAVAETFLGLPVERSK